MSRRLRSSLWVITAVLLAAGTGMAQSNIGIDRFQSYQSGTFDTVNLYDLNVHFGIPVTIKAGRGIPFYYIRSYDSLIWGAVSGTSGTSWTPVQNWGWRGQTDPVNGYIGYNTGQIHCTDPNTGQTIYSTTYHGWTYNDHQGTAHPFALNLTDGACPGTNISGTAVATDGSGYTLTANTGNSPITATAYAKQGGTINAPLQNPSGTGTDTDSNGNQVTIGTSTFTDTLGVTALTISGTNPVSYTYPSYTSTGALTSSSVKVYYSTYMVKTNFGCSGIAEYGPTSQSLVSKIVLGDGVSTYTFSYEATPGFAGDVTGRIASVILATGGKITYSYSGGDNGIECDGTTAGLTRTTPDGTWSYSRTGSSPTWATKVTDPANNVTTIHFQRNYETERDVNQGSTLVETVYTCYNIAPPSSCNSTSNTTSITAPIHQRIIATEIFSGAAFLESELYEAYDFNSTTNVSYGRLSEKDEYDYGNGAVGALLRKTVISYASLGNGIYDRPSSITVEDSGGAVWSKTLYTYDEGTVASNATVPPQHVSISGSRGNPTTIQSLVAGSTYLTRHVSYYNTGMVNTTTDVNNQVTTYNFGSTSSASCGYAFPISISLPVNSLSMSMTWNCNMARKLSDTDANSQKTTYAYNDPLWRITAVTDPENNTTTTTYTGLNTVESVLSFNGGASSVDITTTLDGSGRAYLNQQKDGTNWDTTETDYDSYGRVKHKSLLFSTATKGSGAANPNAAGTSYAYDVLDRTTSVTDSGGGSTSLTYTENDVVKAVAAPAGENSKQWQYEYDGLGRLTSVCEITSATGSGNCAQTTSKTGYWTKYAFQGPLALIHQVTQNAQGSTTQIRTYNYDDIGRLTSETNPEAGTTTTPGTVTYTYDTDTTCGTSTGDLVKRQDPIGNVTCSAYDGLHRLTAITYPSGSYAASTAEKHYVYDGATVNSVAMANPKGRLAEAYTGPSTGKITDLGFSYSTRGEVDDTYQSSPNSGGYYHLSATYWPHGLLETLGVPSVPLLTYNVDSTGRVASVTVPSGQGQNPVTSVAYGAAVRPDAPTSVTFGSGDSDGFGYDANTGRMTSYKYVIGSTPQTYTGSLQWNQNGTVQTLTITDPFDSAENQTCTYGYDDLARVGSVNCVNGTTNIWNQNFAYGALGNITKTVPTGGTGTSFQASYNNLNEITTVGSVSAQYDLNGNLTFDPTTSIHYTWDAENRPASLNGFPLTIDALGRVAEKNAGGGVYYQYVFAPTGDKVAVYKGQTLSRTYLPLPGGAEVNYGSSGISAYAHADWLGSIRLATSQGRSVLADIPYGPFGEPYSTRTGTYSPEFTGRELDITSPLYDFMMRENNYIQGRWISPDPAGLAAVDPSNPQTWNRYAYVANGPLNQTDPLGLLSIWSDVVGSARTAGRGYNYNAFSFIGTSLVPGSSEQQPSYDFEAFDTSLDFTDSGVSQIDSPEVETVDIEGTFGEFSLKGINLGDSGSLGGVVFSGGTATWARSAGAANIRSWLQKSLGYLKKVPVNLTIIVPVLGVVGPAVTVTYLPQTHNLCVAPGLGASVGRNVSAGPLILGNLSNAKAITEGASISVGAQATPFLGAQATGNFSGILGGPTVGIPGGSVTATYGMCF